MVHQSSKTIIFGFLLIMIFSGIRTVHCQTGVGMNIDGSVPHASAMLHIKSTDKGLLIPRTDTSSISSPAVGLLIFQSSNETFYYRNSSHWMPISYEAELKDKDSDTKIEVERNPDDDIIRFSIAGSPAWTMEEKQLIPKGTGRSLFIGQGAGENDNLNDRNNVFIGDSTGYSNASSQRNVAIGNSALKNMTSGNYNVAVGERALEGNKSGQGNVAIGRLSMNENESGDFNTSAGTNSLLKNTSGDLNVAIGRQALLENTQGEKNVAVGQAALKNNISGNENIAIGRALVSNSIGHNNIAIGNAALNLNTYRGDIVAVGDSALATNSVGFRNVALGARAGKNADANDNTFLGFEAGKSNTLGFQNVFIGSKSGEGITSADYNTFVGSGTGDGNGYKNTLIGNDAGTSIGNGFRNVAVGHASMKSSYLLASGEYDDSYRSVAVGDSALYDARLDLGLEDFRKSVHNIGVGSKALFSLSGEKNIGVGSFAGGNSDGDDNLMLGKNSFAESSGDENIILGNDAAIESRLFQSIIIGNESLTHTPVSSNHLVMIGDRIDFTGTPGECVGIGADIDFYEPTGSQYYSNSVAIGYNASVTGPDKVRIGNSSMASIGGYENWTNVSDGRFKKNIAEDIKGLDFVLGLRPVSYQLDIEQLVSFLKEDEEVDTTGKPVERIPNQYEIESRNRKASKVYSGFIAQEVEAHAKEIGYEFSGVDHTADHDMYGLRYAEFVVPLTKAIQEQQEMINLLKSEIDMLKAALQKAH